MIQQMLKATKLCRKQGAFCDALLAAFLLLARYSAEEEVSNTVAHLKNSKQVGKNN